MWSGTPVASKNWKVKPLPTFLMYIPLPDHPGAHALVALRGLDDHVVGIHGNGRLLVRVFRSRCAGMLTAFALGGFLRGRCRRFRTWLCRRFRTRLRRQLCTRLRSGSVAGSVVDSVVDSVVGSVDGSVGSGWFSFWNFSACCRASSKRASSTVGVTRSPLASPVVTTEPTDQRFTRLAAVIGMVVG